MGVIFYWARGDIPIEKTDYEGISLAEDAGLINKKENVCFFFHRKCMISAVFSALTLKTGHQCGTKEAYSEFDPKGLLLPDSTGLQTSTYI